MSSLTHGFQEERIIEEVVVDEGASSIILLSCSQDKNI
jgi:hypothetical protein